MRLDQHIPAVGEQVPDGVPSLLRIGPAADVLGLSVGTIAGWARRGYIHYAQPGIGKWRYFTAEEISRIAHRFGITPDWLRAIE